MAHRKIILLPESLVGNARNMLFKHSENFSSEEDEFYIFNSSIYASYICDTAWEFDALLMKLKKLKIHIKELEEYSIEEYMLNNPSDEFYVTPTESPYSVIASMALLNFKGTIYMFSSNESEHDITNLNPYAIVFRQTEKAGLRGLDMTVVDNTHSRGTKCHFEIDGETYTQIITGKAASINSGNEGYTMTCPDNDDYIIKIWDSLIASKRQYEIDEVRLMIQDKLSHKSIAFPIAFVYNEDNKPIGFAMKNFKGTKAFDVDDLSKKASSFEIVSEIIKCLLWLKTHNLLHRDISHNMLIDKNEHIAIVDMDSVQYKSFPATASELNPINAIPTKFSSNSLYFNSIDVSYTGMAIIISAFTSLDKFFGVWDEESGLCPINMKIFEKIRKEHPEIASLIKEAYIEGRPVALTRQLEAVHKAIKKKKEHALEDDMYNGDYPIYDEKRTDDEHSTHSDDEIGKNHSMSTKKTSIFKHLWKNKDVKQNSHSDSGRAYHTITKPSITIINVSEIKNPLSNLILLIKKLILSFFATGTVVRESTLESEWNEFIATKKYIKPLVSTSIVLFLIGILITAIITT